MSDESVAERQMRDVWRRSIEHYGKTLQSVVCMEECGELIQAISKMLRGKDAKANLIEEIADVTICLGLLREMYGISEYEIAAMVGIKTAREAARLNGFTVSEREERDGTAA